MLAYRYALDVSIRKPDKVQWGRSVCQLNIKHGNVLTNPARKSVKPGLMIPNASESLR